MSYAARSIVSISPALDPSIEIAVCLPCFRRPKYLQQTLDSLAAQRTDRRFAVVMVENDAMASESAAVAAKFLEAGKLAGLCVVEPNQGNCHAINTAFDIALANFPFATHFLMIDDDEMASVDWLERMVSAAEITRADVVGGPVKPKFDEQDKQSLRHHPAFRPAYDASGAVPVIYGCGNCLITRPVFERLGLPAFDIRFNFLGGGDTDFFIRCRRAGLRFHWVEEAVIVETVPKSRTRASWLAMRGLRIGAINYHVQRKAAQTPWLQACLLAKIMALLPLSLLRASRLAVTEQQAIIALHPMAVALGGLLALFGIEPQPYKASKILS